MDDALNKLGAYVEETLAVSLVSWSVKFSELTLVANAQDIVAVLKMLRDDQQCQFINFIDICGVDYPQRSKRFDVVYHLLSPKLNQRIRIKVEADEETAVPSSVHVFPAADWFEREAYDMYGILFSGHPDLRRMLTDYGFVGHPLRKDFPMTGEVEVRYDDELKRVIYEPVHLGQAFRNFDFESPWEGAGAILPGDEKASVKDEAE